MSRTRTPARIGAATGQHPVAEADPAHRQRQGRHRQDHHRRRAGLRVGHRRPSGAGLRGRGPARHHRPVRTTAAGRLRGASADAARPAAGRCTGWRSTPRTRCWSTWSPSTTSASPPRPWTSSAPSTSRRRSRPDCATCCSPARCTRPSAARPRAWTARTTPWSWTPRPPAGSPSSSTSTRPCPDWPRSARSAARPTRSTPCSARKTTVVHLVTLLEDMPVTETEEAIEQLRTTQIAVGTVIANMVRSMPLTDDQLQVFADGNGRLDGRRVRRGGEQAAGRRVRASRPPGRWTTAVAVRCWTASASRWPRSPSTRAASTRTRSSPSPTSSAATSLWSVRTAIDRRPGVPRRRRPDRRTSASGSRSSAAPAGSARRPAQPRSPCVPPRPAARSSCSPSTRPGGWRSRSGVAELDNTPRPVKGIDAGQRRQPGRDDAGHEADLRRGRAGPLHPGERPARSWRTRSTWRCRRSSRARRSTWRWRSSASCTPRRWRAAPGT